MDRSGIHQLCKINTTTIHKDYIITVCSEMVWYYYSDSSLPPPTSLALSLLYTPSKLISSRSFNSFWPKFNNKIIIIRMKIHNQLKPIKTT